MNTFELLQNAMRSMEYTMKRAEEGLPPVSEIEGDKLYTCAKCKNDEVYMISRDKVDATNKEKSEELEHAKLLANALSIDIKDVLDEEIDFKRLEWRFLCEKCGTISKVRTEVDRY